MKGKLTFTQPFWLVMACIIDALFFIAYGFFTFPIKEKISENAILIANKLGPMMAEKQAGILQHLLGPELRGQTGILLILICILFLILYLIYTIFQGTTWWMASQISHQKETYKKYFLGFAKINLIWITGFIIYKILDTFISLRAVLIQKIVPGAPNIAAHILLLALIFLVITAVMSYPKQKAKQIFKTPWKITIPLIALSASIYLTARYIIQLLSTVVPLTFSFLIAMIIIFPIIIYVKVYITRVITHVHTRN